MAARDFLKTPALLGFYRVRGTALSVSDIHGLSQRFPAPWHMVGLDKVLTLTALPVLQSRPIATHDIFITMITLLKIIHITGGLCQIVKDHKTASGGSCQQSWIACEHRILNKFEISSIIEYYPLKKLVILIKNR